MTFLQLCQFVQRYIAAGDDLPGNNAPPTVVSQTGLYREIVGWVQDAYRDIQQEESNWLFRQVTGTLALSSGWVQYTKAAIQTQIPTYERIYPYINGDSRFVNLLTTGTGGPLQIYNCYYIPFDKWAASVAGGLAIPVAGLVPPYFTIRPNEALSFFPMSAWAAPVTSVSLTFQFIQTVVNLTADADVPIWPTEWHDAIAWRAIRYWAIVRESANKYAIADGELQRVMKALRASQLADPEPTIEPATKDAP